MVFLDAFRVHWAALGLSAFRPSFHWLGGDSSRRGHSLWGSGPPPLTEVGLIRGPSPPLLMVFSQLSSIVARCVSLQFRALSRPLTMSWPCRTWFACSIMDLSMFLRNFSVPVGPAELRPPPGVVTLFPQGLTRGLCIPFRLRLGGSLPGHRSSSQPLPRLELLACATFLRFESLTPELCMVYPSPSSRVVGAKVVDLLCSSVCRLHCTCHPNTSRIALGYC